MQVVLLGTGGYHPSELRHTACIMLPELGIVFDAGTSFFRVRELLCTSTLDIFLSHAHLDHVIGLPFFQPLYSPDNTFTVHGFTSEGVPVAQILERLMSPPYFPVSLKNVPASMEYKDAEDAPY